MSNHAARPHPRLQSRTARLTGYLFVPLVVALTIAFAPRVYRRWFLPDDAWQSYSGRVIGTRVVRSAISDSYWGNSIVYRVEIDAAWTENGSAREAWVPTMKTGTDRAWLALWTAQQGKHCIVRESPRNPAARLAYFGY